MPPHAAKAGCTRLYTQADHRQYARKVYGRDSLTRKARKRVMTMRRCQTTPKAVHNALHKTRVLRRRYKARKLVSSHTSGLESWLAKVRACESGGNYATNTGNGFYGAYQFDLGTWASVGGSGLPSNASPAEQDMRAAMLYKQRGSSPWPVCG